MSGGKIASTTNSGFNWFIQQPFPLIGNNVTDIFFCNNTIGWAAVGSLQKTFKTTNGGINWGYQVNPSTALRISFVDTLRGWGGNLGITHTTNGGGQIIYLGVISVTNKIPEQFKLYQNYPNPFNPTTTINFDLNKGGLVKLIIFDVLGREVTALINEKLSIGSYKYVWNGSNMKSGVYFYNLATDKYSETKKMILIK